MSIEKMETILEKIRIATQDPTLTAEERLERVVELLGEYQSLPKADVTTRQHERLVLHLKEFNLAFAPAAPWSN
jgi:hypothetical protein